MKNTSNFKTLKPRLLSDLNPGEEAVVITVSGEQPASRRLRDLGLLPETRVRAVRRAPLGDPTVYAFRGYRLCLRQREAALVEIETRTDPRAPEEERVPTAGLGTDRTLR